MGLHVTKAPDGQLARFSDIADYFIHSAEEELAICMTEHGMFEQAAQENVFAGLDDWEPPKLGVKGDGQARLKDGLENLLAGVVGPGKGNRNV